MLLPSFPSPLHAIVIGHSGGIGAALLAALLQDEDVAQVTAGSRRLTGQVHPKLSEQSLDITDEASIFHFAEMAGNAAEPPRLIIVATGLLHDGTDFGPEKSIRALDADRLQRAFLVNAIGPALVAKHLLPIMPRTGKAVFAALSARVSSVSDNRLGGWHGYRASKAALNMMIRNLHIEQSAKAPDTLCIGLHPGTVDTGLSAPFQRGVAEGKLFTTAQSAGHLFKVIDGLGAGDGGKLWAWDGKEVAP